MKLQAVNCSLQKASKANNNDCCNSTSKAQISFAGSVKAPNKFVESSKDILGEVLASFKTLLGFKISSNPVSKVKLDKTV